jgi:MFS family permease
VIVVGPGGDDVVPVASPSVAGDGGTRLGRRFAALWTSSTASAFGTGLATVATPLFVASRTGDPLVVSLASAVTWLPWLLFALPGGVLVDRLDRRRLMVVIDWLRAAAMAGLAAVVLTRTAGLPVLLVVLFLVSTGEVLARAASQALLPALVPRARLERANGLLYGGATVAQQMVAGPLGGLLFTVAAALPFVANAATFAVSAVVLTLVAGSYRAGPERPRAAARSLRGEVLDGLRWLRGQRLLRTMALLIGLLNVTLTAALAVLVLLARERLGLGSVGYGLLFTCLAVGGVVGALVGDRLVARVTATWTIRVGLLVEAATHLVLAASRSSLLVGLTLFLFGVHGALWGIVGSSLRQRLAPPEMLGRVGSSMLFVAAGGNCLGAVLGGALASAFGLTAPYWVGFGVAVVVIACTWRVFDRATVARAYATEPGPSVEAAATGA